MDQRQQSIEARQLTYCTLCGACDAACPIGLRPMQTILAQGQKENMLEPFAARAPKTGGELLLSPNKAVRRSFSQSQWVDDCGIDIAKALANGDSIDSQRLQQFIAPLVLASQIVVSDGLLYYALRHWLPNTPLVTLAERLLPKLHHHLQAGDLLLLDPPAFHANYDYLLPIVQQATRHKGVELNLDLQRLAVSLRSYRLDTKAALRARWQWLSLHHTINRIICENPDETTIAAAVSGLPALWLGDLEPL